ncbi:MAG: ROK family protein [Pseudobdellovibrionaceae bacterium]|nr:ROK family protein [Bdellovibrionales bacterium]USN47478.1 MAG: ROK family protein [Pseudobdellovibrionaceae bacterium]
MSTSHSQSESHVLAFDLGGTKVAAAIVARDGTIVQELKEPVKLDQGPKGLVEQMMHLSQSLPLKQYSIRVAGVASAGPLDPKQGLLLNPTNFLTEGQGWGVVPLVELLTRALSMPVVLENDAAAAALAENWLGQGQGVENLVVMTLGTGLGVAAIANGALVRSGRGLHPEAGHVTLKFDDTTALCNCGRFGCAEAYLSGPHFARRASSRWGSSPLSANYIAERAQAGDAHALAAFSEYAQQMAAAMANYCVLYGPEIIVLAGGFSRAVPLYLDQAKGHLQQQLARRREDVDLMPQLKISRFQEEAGVLGAARVAFAELT